MSVFKKQSKSHMESLMFFDGGVDVARYDQVKYPALEKITEKMLGFYWRPEEVDKLITMKTIAIAVQYRRNSNVSI